MLSMCLNCVFVWIEIGGKSIITTPHLALLIGLSMWLFHIAHELVHLHKQNYWQSSKIQIEPVSVRKYDTSFVTDSQNNAPVGRWKLHISGTLVI